MPTQKQKLAAKKLSENVRNGNPKSAGEILRESGYSRTTSEAPSSVIGRAGFQVLLDQYLPDDMLLRALEEDIKNKPGSRKSELELAFKLKGRINTDSSGGSGDTYNTFIGENNINPNAPSAKEMADSMYDVLMERTKASE